MIRSGVSPNNTGMTSARSRWIVLVLLCLAVAARIEAATLVPAQPSSTKRLHSRPEVQIRGDGGSGDNALLDGIKNSLASALAAACSKTILAPFDTIKTVQQHSVAADGSALKFWPAAQLITSRKGGFMELYAGLGVSVLGAMPSVGLYFGVYSYCKRTIYPALQRALGENVPQSVLWTLSIATSAAVGNTVASFSRVPYEVVKQKLQTGAYASTMQAIREMASSQGWRAFFPMGGVSTQMLRDIPYAMVTLLSYEYLRHQFVRPYQERHASENSAWCDMAAGAVAGGIGSYVTNPFDVLKTRLQTDSDVYNGSISLCARLTWEEGGAMAFLRGSVPRLLHKVPANGAFFLFYEFFRKLLHVDSKDY